MEERDIYLKELTHAKEAFITGTTKKVMPVVQVDDCKIGNWKPGKITQDLQRQFEEYVQNYILVQSPPTK